MTKSCKPAYGGRGVRASAGLPPFDGASSPNHTPGARQTNSMLLREMPYLLVGTYYDYGVVFRYSGQGTRVKERFKWEGQRLTSGQARFLVGFCAAVILTSGVILVVNGPSLVSVLVWIAAASFVTKIVTGIWRTRKGQSEDRDGDDT